MQPAGPTLKKIFAATVLRQGQTDAPILAWPLACGAKVAGKTNAVSYADGVLTVEVLDVAWQQQLQDFQREYLAALLPLTAQPVRAIKFVVKGLPERPAR